MGRKAQGETRERLVECATEMIAEVGFAGITVTALTSRVGVSQPAYYSHFKDLNALHVEVIKRLSGQLSAFTRDAQVHLRASGATDPVAMTEHFTKIFARMDQDRPFIDLYLKYRHGKGPLGEEMRQVEAEAIQNIREHIHTNLQTWGINHEGGEEAASQCAVAIYMAVLGAYDMYRTQEVELEQTAKILMTQVLGITLACFEQIEEVLAVTPLEWRRG